MTDFYRLRTLIREEERLRWAIEKQEARATKMTASFSASGGGGSGKTGSQVEDGAIMLAALKDEHTEKLQELKEARNELRAGIAMAGGRKLGKGRTFIRMRYIMGIDVKRIAEGLHYSETYIHRVLRNSEALINKAQRAQGSAKKRTV